MARQAKATRQGKHRATRKRVVSGSTQRIRTGQCWLISSLCIFWCESCEQSYRLVDLLMLQASRRDTACSRHVPLWQVCISICTVSRTDPPHCTSCMTPFIICHIDIGCVHMLVNYEWYLVGHEFFMIVYEGQLHLGADVCTHHCTYLTQVYVQSIYSSRSSRVRSHRGSNWQHSPFESSNQSSTIPCEFPEHLSSVANRLVVYA